MTSGSVKLAFKTVRAARWRSLLTMSGIIVGVLAVITTVSVALGVKQQLTGQVGKFKNTVLTINPGGHEAPSTSTLLRTGNLGVVNESFSEADLTTVRQTPGVAAVAPLGIGSGFATVNGQRLSGATIIATTGDLPDVISHKVEFGTFFDNNELQQPVVVIGQTVATQLFQEQSPIGRTLQIRGQDFTVRGVFSDFDAGFLPIGADLNRAVFIPYPYAQSIANGAVTILQIYVKANTVNDVPVLQKALTERLTQAHSGQNDFTIYRSTEQVQASAHAVELLGQMVTAIAAISLVVGGLGIINIMLVSVTERTREIGIRKAVGATNRQIMTQFLVEAAVLSALGGIIGVLLALLTVFIIRLSTDLHPLLSIPVVIITPLLAWVLGIIFGILPALKAAHKDPIEALRYE